jgi:hypothetical protein
MGPTTQVVLEDSCGNLIHISGCRRHQTPPDHDRRRHMTAPANSALPFRAGWWSFDLGHYRPCDSTYCLWPAAGLPPLMPLDGSLRWLGPLDPSGDPALARRTAEVQQYLAEVRAEAERLSLRLPDAYTRLMGAPELQDRIPSCTACEFTFPDAVIPCPGSERGYVVGFLNDQQDVLLWYLYLAPDGAECVLCSSYDLEALAGWNDGAGPTADERAAVIDDIRIVAPSFVAFIYRFWLENTLWIKLNEPGGGDLSAAERAYLAHFEQGQPRQ